MMKQYLYLVGILMLINTSVLAQSTSRDAEKVNRNVFVQYGVASYYSDDSEGKLTTSGEKFRQSRLTAAHLVLPLGSIVRVTNVNNERSVEVLINDRGPFVEGRLIDLSRVAAEELGFVQAGLADVKIEAIGFINIRASNTAQGDARSSDNMSPVRLKKYYTLTVNEEHPKQGYGVQIGSFSAQDNLVRIVDQIPAKYRKKVFVEMQQLNQVKVFKVIIARYMDIEKAEKLKMKLSEHYPGCFLFTFSK